MISEQLKYFRKKFNKNQDEIAEILKIPKTTYCGYEHGARKVPIEILCNLADYYNVSVNELVGRKKAPYPFDDLLNNVLDMVKKLNYGNLCYIAGRLLALLEKQEEENNG